MISTSKYLNISQAAQELGVSNATIRNWIRAELLSPQMIAGKNAIERQSLEDLKEKIYQGKIPKLRARANKTASSLKKIPVELLGKEISPQVIQQLLQLFRRHQQSLEFFLFNLAFNQLTHYLGTPPDLFLSTKEDRSLPYKTRLLISELREWARELQLDASFKRNLLEFTCPSYPYLLGAIYQSLATESEKGKGGVYYTPLFLIEKMVQENLDQPGKVLDPCCGTGAFLLVALKKLIQLKVQNPLIYLFGTDQDRIAVHITKFTLLLECPADLISSPNIFLADPLLIGKKSSNPKIPIRENYFDLVLSNPPWGARYPKLQFQNYQDLFPEIDNRESFSFFIIKALNLLKCGGKLSYILPESILNIRTHTKIRKVLVEQTSIQKIDALGRIFTGVFSPAIRLDLVKTPAFDSKIEISLPHSHYVMNQQRAKNTQDFLFNINSFPKDEAILQKIKSSPHTNLTKQAKWALGIVTGNNKKFVSTDRQENGVPVLRGKDIYKYSLIPPTHYLKFIPKQFQQCAKKELFQSKEKLIYRFVSRYLVFHYDTSQHLALNSANILIPNIPHLELKYILAILNSSLSQFIFEKTFSSFKVLKQHLEFIPIPELSLSQRIQIIDQVDFLLNPINSKEKRRAIFRELDETILQFLPLDSQEKDYILSKISLEKLIP